MVPGEFLGRHALLFARDDEQREHGQHRAVHGHRHRHLLERDAGEQRAHVVDGIDRDARHADVAAHARMIGVIAAVGGEIEGDGEALLPGRDVAAIEGVGILGRREAGVLADGPGLQRVHRGIGAAHERRDAGQGVEEVESGGVGLRRRGLMAIPSGASQAMPARACRRRQLSQCSSSAILVKSGMPVMPSPCSRSIPRPTAAAGSARVIDRA